MINECFFQSCWQFSNVINDSLKWSSSGFVTFVSVIISFSFCSLYGSSCNWIWDVGCIKHGIWNKCWVYLYYCLGEILSFCRWKYLDNLCMFDLNYLRVVSVYNLIFFDLVNSFYPLRFGYLVDFQKLTWLEYYSNTLPLYLYLGWLAPECFKSLGISLLSHLSNPWSSYLFWVGSIMAYLIMFLPSKLFISLFWHSISIVFLSQVNLSDRDVCISFFIRNSK